MNTSYDERRIWYDWFVYRFFVHKEGGGHGITMAKLRKNENAILSDDLVWSDVLWRHGFVNTFPWKAILFDKANYDHAMGNFWGMIYPMFR